MGNDHANRFIHMSRLYKVENAYLRTPYRVGLDDLGSQNRDELGAREIDEF